jgi:hypothetical protein
MQSGTWLARLWEINQDALRFKREQTLLSMRYSNNV